MQVLSPKQKASLIGDAFARRVGNASTNDVIDHKYAEKGGVLRIK